LEDKPLVIMTTTLPQEWMGDSLADCRVIPAEPGSKGISREQMKHLPDAAGILCLLDHPIPTDILQAGKKLKVISNMAVGVENIDVQTCTRLGIVVGNTPGVLTDGTADLTLALLLAVCRQIPQASRDAREGRWSNWDPTGWLGADLKGATVGILGLGKIGTAVARRLLPFGCTLIFTSRSPHPELEKALDATQVIMDDLLEKSDILCLHVPLTPETTKLIDAEALGKMKRGAILINASRGAVVDSEALYQALADHKLRAAGLDVTDPEPLPPDHQLFRLDNCLITPHIGSATENTRRTMAGIAIRNLLAGIQGEPLPFCVNPEASR
jgi:glyoxylate reductase